MYTACRFLGQVRDPVLRGVVEGAGEDGAVHTAHDGQPAVRQRCARRPDERSPVGDGRSLAPKRFLDFARNDKSLVGDLQRLGVEAAPDIEAAARSKGDGLEEGFGQVRQAGPDILADGTGIDGGRADAARQVEPVAVARPAALLHRFGQRRQGTEDGRATLKREFIDLVRGHTADIATGQDQRTVHRKGGPVRRGVRQDANVGPFPVGMGPDIGINPLGAPFQEAFVREVRAARDHQRITHDAAERRRHPLRIRRVGNGFQFSYFHRFRMAGHQARRQDQANPESHHTAPRP